MRRTLTTVLTLSLLASAQVRELPPATGAPKPYNVPAAATFELKNGLRVTLLQRSSLPVVSISARIAPARVDESPEETWSSDLALEMLKEGTETQTAEQIAIQGARMGGQLSTTPGDDESSLDLNVLSEFADDGLRLIADVLQHPGFPSDAFDRVRTNQIRRRKIELAAPRPLADQAFRAALFRDHPYGRIYPTEDQLKRYSVGDIRRFYAANSGPLRTHLLVAGMFDLAIRQKIEAVFGNWAGADRRQPLAPREPARAQLILIDRPGAEQSTLRIGQSFHLPPGHPDYLALELTNDLLGVAFTSRIIANLREKHGYSYFPFSRVRVLGGASFWQESADVTTEHTADSIREILSEIARLANEAPDANELNAMKRFDRGMFLFNNYSNSSIIDEYVFMAAHSLSSDYLQRREEIINAMKPEQLCQMTQKYLHPTRMLIVVVGDKQRIGGTLDQFSAR